MEYMNITGGCYCGAIRYRFDGDVTTTFQCHCRECQYVTGGQANIVYVLQQENFTFVKGSPATYARQDIEEPVTRFFCADCGTPLGSISPKRPGAFILKVGTADKPEKWSPQFAIFTCDMQPYHTVPDDVPKFEKRPQANSQ